MAPLPPASVSESAAWRQFIQTTLNLKFDLTTGWFWIRVADSLQLVPISEIPLLALLCRTIGAEPTSKLSLSQLKQLVGELKISSAEANSDAVQDLRQFVQARVVRQPGCDLTSGELLAAYRADKREYGALQLTDYEFQHQLPGIIRACFGIAKRHDIQRLDCSGNTTHRKARCVFVMRPSDSIAEISSFVNGPVSWPSFLSMMFMEIQ
jgi:hypothetical protein